ncbi:MAG TPA: HAMP domain-containing sensor histidine kinase [Roseiflexaceae bacterium]|nr:HAMP domain-containing sensor histidine kinase [Roseiflexaceae bacterium]
MIQLQPDHEYLSALLELMAAIQTATDPRAIAERALEQLLTREALTGGGIWLARDSALDCVAYHNIAPDDLLPEIQQALDMSTQSGRAQSSPLIILPLQSAGSQVGALALAAPASLAAQELLLLRAAASHLGAALASAQLARNEREWQTFISHAAHEIKNPLASIKGYADLLLRRAAKDPADPYRKGLTTISIQVGRTTALLEQLSDITRIDGGSLAIDRRAGDFAALVEQVVREYQSGEHAATIVFDTSATALPGDFDYVRLRQVVSALLSNAIKFSPDGGTIAVRLRQSDSAEEGPVAILSVSDTGVGVPAGEQERIFERFFRGSNIQGTYAGLGLGLYIARHILDLHGGRIWLQSERGQGTTCHVELPLVS